MNFTKIFGIFAVLTITFVFAERVRVVEEQSRLKRTLEADPASAGKMGEAILKEVQRTKQSKEAVVDAEALEKILKSEKPDKNGKILVFKNLDKAVQLMGNLAGKLKEGTAITTSVELAKIIKENDAQEKAIQAKVKADVELYDKLSKQAEAIGRNFNDPNTAKKLEAGIKHTILSSKGDQGTIDLLTSSGNLLRKLSLAETDPAAQKAAQENIFLLEKILNTPASQGFKARFASMLKASLTLKGINKEQANAETAAKAYRTVTEEYSKGLLEQMRILAGKDIKGIREMKSEEVSAELNRLEIELIGSGKLNDEIMQGLENKALESLNKFLMEKLGIKSLEELEKIKKECCLMTPCSVDGLAGKPGAGENFRNLAKPAGKDH